MKNVPRQGREKNYIKNSTIQFVELMFLFLKQSTYIFSLKEKGTCSDIISIRRLRATIVTC